MLHFCVSVHVQILGTDKRSRLIAANAVLASLVADLERKVMPSDYGIAAFKWNAFMAFDFKIKAITTE